MATRNENIRYTTYLNDKEVGKSMNSMYNHARKLKNEIRRLEVGSKEWVSKMAELDKVNKNLKPLQQRMRGLQSPMSKLKDLASGLLPAFSFAAIGTGLVQLGKDVLGTATKLEQIDKRARIVFGDSFPKVSAEAERLAGKMGLTNKELLAAATNTGDLLIPLDFTREKAAEMSMELQSLAGALNEWSGGQLGAAEVSNILTKAMLGENEQLKQLGIAIRQDSEEFRNLVKQKIEAEGVTKAQARALATLELIQKKSTDAQTAYLDSGNNLLRMQQSLTLGWKKMKEWLAGLFIEEKQQSDIFVAQQAQINSLVSSITSLNEGNDIRAKLLADLNKYYPALLEGLDQEKVTNEELLKLLPKINAEYEKKIQIAVLEEKISDVTARNIELANTQYDATTRINDAYDKYIKDKQEGLTLEEKYQALMDKELYDIGVMTTEWANLNDATGSVTMWDIVSSHIAGTKENMDMFNEAQEERNKLQEDYNKLVADLSLQSGPSTGGTGGTGGGGGGVNTGGSGKQGGIKAGLTAGASGQITNELSSWNMGPFPMDPETQAFIDEQMAEHMQKLQEFQWGIQQMGMEGKQKDISDTQLYYDQLISQADWFRENDFLSEEEHLELKKQLYAMYKEDISNIENYYREQKERMDETALEYDMKNREAAVKGTLQVYGNMLGAIASLYGEQSEEAKSLAAFVTGMNAVSSAVAAYNSAANIPYVGFILGPIAAASALAYGYAQVKKILSTKTPQYNAGYELGGPTLPYPHGAMVGEAGEEYMIPNWLRGDPQVAAYENIIEAKRASGPQAITNNYSQAAPVQGTDPALLATMQEMNETMKSLKENGVQGVWDWDRYKEGRDEMEAIEEEAKIS